MKTRIAFFIYVTLTFAGCRSNYFTKDDFRSVLKIDAHVHINSDKGYFEEQAIKDNFVLVTLGVDHSDSSSVKQQLDYAILSS
ncbi:MAG TPA: hypothetical protein VGK38_01095, partial [Prolixibacteraceae bacterium]